MSERSLVPPSPAALRADLERLVLLDLLGPAGGPEEEIAEGSVRDRYLVGMLAPRQQQIAPEEQDDLNQSGEDAPDDVPIDGGRPRPFGGRFFYSRAEGAS